jgi:hypothetical protein
VEIPTASITSLPVKRDTPTAVKSATLISPLTGETSQSDPSVILMCFCVKSGLRNAPSTECVSGQIDRVRSQSSPHDCPATVTTTARATNAARGSVVSPEESIDRASGSR